MKTQAVLAILFTAAMAVAEPIDPIMGKPFSQLTDEEKAIRKRKIEEFQGGILMVEPTGPRYVVMDVRGNPDETPEGVAKVFKDVLKIGVDVERSAPPDKDCPMVLAKKRLDAKALAVVVAADESPHTAPKNIIAKITQKLESPVESPRISGPMIFPSIC